MSTLHEERPFYVLENVGQVQVLFHFDLDEDECDQSEYDAHDDLAELEPSVLEDWRDSDAAIEMCRRLAREISAFLSESPHLLDENPDL